MSVSASMAALLIASAPVAPSSTPPEVPALSENASASTQDTPASSATPAIPPLPNELIPAAGAVEAQLQAEPAPPVSSLDKDQGDIVVTARQVVPGDPLRGLNVVSSEAMQVIDKAVIGPAALAFERVVPPPIRSGLRNVLYNLEQPVIFLNFLIQLKPGKAAETLGRFAINSTIGVAGLFDIAKRRPFRLPHRRNGFGNSLAFYGVGPGPFLFLPVIGPTTLRDLFGTVVDQLVLPTAVGKPFNRTVYSVPRFLVRELDQRAGFEEELRIMRATSDFYAARREFYLRTRQAEIDELRGKRDGEK